MRLLPNSPASIRCGISIRSQPDDHGAFEFTDLPPGSYVFGINLTKETYDKPRRGARIFLPRTSVESEATVFELKAGDRKDLGTLRLTAR